MTAPLQYFPLIRGRQWDLLALSDLLQQGQLSPRIVPIIEPVKDSSALAKVLRAATVAQHPLFVIANASVGDYGLLAEPRYPLVWNEWVQPARWFDPLDAPLVLAQTKTQAALLAPEQRAVVPNAARVRALAHPRAIYLEDHTPGRQRTEDYASIPDEFYQYQHAALPGIGFADYPLSRATYDPHGYPQRAIALHLLYPGKNGTLWMHHFVSQSNDGFDAPGEKFFEAAATMQDWLATHPEAITPGTTAISEALAARHFPGLGAVRKWQLSHFLTIMGRWLT
ncbi:sce7725 family protein [Lacticaseibacillus mingshuiensis]|uniref:Sce7725 family protein n=1 Tax=Lacticaseibacillus mingshuiensis TaxID=2799574 RepID=A0ABW4CHQ3_9LACO|nr:sce7725 family protein [Lacticaseibacillus mingshuiensis]